MTKETFNYQAIAAGRVYCGTDEVARGNWASSTMAASCILPEGVIIEGVMDSKKVSKARRADLAAEIKEKALAWSVSEVSVREIDETSILQAALKAMRESIVSLSVNPAVAFIDGNKLPELPEWVEGHAVVKGDALIPSVSAASILAKAAKDEDMKRLDALYPEYGFYNHMGYGTKQHQEALRKYGPIKGVHRMSYAPIKKLMEQGGWS